MSVLLTPPFLQFFANDGQTPLAYGKIYTYASGTTTPKATYTDQTAATEAANPVVLDSMGRCTIWIDGSYKIIVKDALDTTIRTTDNITSFNTLAESASAFFQSFSGNGSDTVFTLSSSLGTDEKAVMVFVDQGLREYSTNGTFTTDSGWTKGAGWSIGTGVATAAGALSTAITQDAAITLVAGQSYTVTFTITRDAGSLTPSIGGTAGTARSSAGTYSETIIAGSTQAIAFTGASFTGTLDNVTVKQVISKGYDIINPSAYTLSGTSLTFAEAPATGTNNIFVFAPSLLLGAASASAAAAAVSETNAAASAVLAEDWATKTDGIVAATDYSSKAYAIGGTGLTTGSAKDWATDVSGTVDATEYSAKAYAQADLTGATGGSAKDWAVTAEDTEVTTGLYSSLHYAAKSADSAVESANQATKLTGTSTSSVAIGTGSKVFTTQADKDFNGNNVRVYSDADPTNYMDGLASYSGTTLTVTVSAIGGSGTFTDWTIRVNGVRGATGAAGNLTDGDYTDASVSGTGTVITLEPEAISGKTEAVIASGDSILFSDVNDSGNLKRDTVDGIADVVVGATRTYTGAQKASQSTLTSTSASIAINFADNNDFTHTFTEDTTLANPSNIAIGQSGAIFFTQHASSPKTLAFGSYWDFAGGTAPTVTATNSARDTLFYHVRSATQIEASLVKGWS